MRGTDLPATDSIHPPTTIQPVFYCPACAYDLRATESDRCPECGLVIDRERISSIPWVHRKTVGHIRSFWKTTYYAVRHPSRIAQDISTDVDYRSGVRFRMTLTNWLFCTIVLPAIASGILFVSKEYQPFIEAPTWFGFAINWSIVPILGVSLWLALFMALGVQSYFFHPKALPVLLQNRAIALSEYVSAPLALLPIAVAFVFAGGITGERQFATRSEFAVASVICWFVAAIVGTVTLAGWIFAGPRVLVRTTQCTYVRVAAYTITVPLLSILCFAVGLVVPAAWLFLLLVVFTR